MGDHFRLCGSTQGRTQGKLTRAVEALYWQTPPAEELAPLGMSVSDYSPPECQLWEENWPAVKLFNTLAGQWRMGPSGPVALDYIVLFHELDRMRLEGAEYDDLFGSIRVMEDAALTILRNRK